MSGFFILNLAPPGSSCYQALIKKPPGQLEVKPRTRQFPKNPVLRFRSLGNYSRPGFRAGVFFFCFPVLVVVKVGNKEEGSQE